MKLSKYMCLNKGIDIRRFVPVSRITSEDKKKSYIRQYKFDDFFLFGRNIKSNLIKFNGDFKAEKNHLTL